MTVLCGGKVQTLRWARTLFCRVWTYVPVDTRGNKSNHHMDPVARPSIHCGVAHNHKGWLAYHEDDGTFEAFIDGKFEEQKMPMLAPPALPLPLPPPGPVPSLPMERGTFEPPVGLPPDEPPATPARLPQLTDMDTPLAPPRVASGRPPSPPWQLPGEQPELQPRRRGSKATAAQRFAAPGINCTATMEAMWAGTEAELDPEDALDATAVAHVEGCPFLYECFADPVPATPSAFASSARRAAKIRFFNLPSGVVQLEVPRNYNEAMRHRRAPQLWQAMIREMHAQYDCKSHHLVHRTPDMQPLPLAWVYDFKLKDGDVFDKARLIGWGNLSTENVHFFEKTSQVARCSSVRVCCAYAAQYNLTLTTGDVPTAYLQSYLHNVIVYSEQAPGFEQPGPNGEPARDMVCRWDRSLYGFRPSGFEWGEEFYDWLLDYGATACYADTKVFVLVKTVTVNSTSIRMVLIITLHVDDLLLAGSLSCINPRHIHGGLPIHD